MVYQKLAWVILRHAVLSCVAFSSKAVAEPKIPAISLFLREFIQSKKNWVIYKVSSQNSKLSAFAHEITTARPGSAAKL